ncbi:MAG: hypothetical protein LBJ00_15170, partial [Planctomycetaceae bacterium]|nr:hypothetical protein [Planctomycetaceae bacterium]
MGKYSSIVEKPKAQRTTSGFQNFYYTEAILKFLKLAVNLQRRALGKRNNVKRLFSGEAYRLIG